MKHEILQYEESHCHFTCLTIGYRKINHPHHQLRKPTDLVTYTYVRTRAVRLTIITLIMIRNNCKKFK